jgi:hypothetical protein
MRDQKSIHREKEKHVPSYRKNPYFQRKSSKMSYLIKNHIVSKRASPGLFSNAFISISTYFDEN